MPIFGSDGGLVGIVDSVIGVRIVLRRDGVSDKDQHYIPLSWVASVTDRVTLDCPAAQARPASATAVSDTPRRFRMFGPATWAGVGVMAVLLLYGASTLIPRARPGKDADAAPTPVAKVAPSPVAKAATPAPAPTRSVPEGPLPATPVAIAEFLNSDAPAPQVFSLDTVGFAPGSASVTGAAEKAVAGIAGVMTTHLNTKIKLAAVPGAGALALRRIAAIRDALIARGVAEYRIATGTLRMRVRGSEMAMVILAK